MDANFFEVRPCRIVFVYGVEVRTERARSHGALPWNLVVSNSP
jgi:hypothetical protein